MQVSRERIRIYQKEHGDDWQVKLLDDMTFELMQSVRAEDEAKQKRRKQIMKDFGLDTIKDPIMPTKAEKLQREHFLKTGEIKSFMTT